MNKVFSTGVRIVFLILISLSVSAKDINYLKPIRKVQGNSIDLSGKWHFQLDNKEKNGTGLKEGWEKPDFDDSSWKTIKVGTSWEQQGYNYNGVAWYRQKVFIPKSWKEGNLLFNLGRPDDRGEVYFNGGKVAEVKKFGPHFAFNPTNNKIKFGALNSIAVRIVDWYKSGGLSSGTFSIQHYASLPLKI